MTLLTAFGLVAVSAMLVTYALEARSTWFILAFAGACLLGSAYGFLQGAWPFGVVEAIWSAVATRRFLASRATARGFPVRGGYPNLCANESGRAKRPDAAVPRHMPGPGNGRDE